MKHSSAQIKLAKGDRYVRVSVIKEIPQNIKQIEEIINKLTEEKEENLQYFLKSYNKSIKKLREGLDYLENKCF